MSRPKQTDATEEAGGSVTSGLEAATATPRMAARDTVPAAPPPAGAPEFDAWLRDHLERLHEAVLSEPVPERFLQLLRG